jgi:predicted Zn-dependent protease
LLAAQAARRAGRLDDAETHLLECERLEGEKDAVTLEWALLRVQRGEMGSLESYLKKCVEEGHTDSSLILEALAMGYGSAYDLPRALYSLDLLLKREPNNLHALLWQGHVLGAMNSPSKAIANYRRILELDPERDEARLFLAEYLATRFQAYQEARTHFARLHEKKPRDPEVTVGLARCYRQLGDSNKARAILDALPAECQDNTEWLFLRGQLALEGRQLAEAEKWLRRAVARNPYYSTALYTLSQCLEQQNNPQEARTFLDRYTQIREGAKQMEQILEQIATTKGTPALYHEAGRICLQNGQEAEALRWFQGALRLDLSYRPTHTVLAELFERTGKKDLAKAHRKLAD